MQNRLCRRAGSLLYWYSYTDARGFPVEHCTGTVNLGDAESIAAELGGPAANPSHPAPDQAETGGGHTLEEAIAQFVSSCHLDRSAATVECYQQKGGHLVRLLGMHQLKKLHIDYVHAYAHKRLEEGAARESVRKELVVLRSTLQLARDRGVLERDPASLIPRFRAPFDPVAGTWHNVRRDLRLACEKGRIDPVSPNDLRRTFASWLKQAGRDSMAVGKLLGHTSSRMVEMTYGHLDHRALAEAMKGLPKLDDILSKLGNPETNHAAQASADSHPLGQERRPMREGSGESFSSVRESIE